MADTVDASGGADRIGGLIRPGRVHRRVYADPEIFALELERIFARAWIYVGHESQAREPGDYLRTRIGRRPMVMVRHEDGSIRVIHNQCAHRGAMVVAKDSGNARQFECCYHGWTYATDGRLIHVPLRHGYPAHFDPDDPAPRWSRRPGWRAIADSSSPRSARTGPRSPTSSAT